MNGDDKDDNTIDRTHTLYRISPNWMKVGTLKKILEEYEIWLRDRFNFKPWATTQLSQIKTLYLMKQL